MGKDFLPGPGTERTTSDLFPLAKDKTRKRRGSEDEVVEDEVLSLLTAFGVDSKKEVLDTDNKAARRECRPRRLVELAEVAVVDYRQQDWCTKIVW